MNGPEAAVAKTVVAILSSNYLLRLGLQRIVEAETWIKLIGQTAHGANLEDVLTNDRPDIAILETENDQAIPELIRKIRRVIPTIKLILLSGFDDVDRTRQAFASGIDGIVLKIQPSAVLIATIAHLARTDEDVALSFGRQDQGQSLSNPAILPSLIPRASIQIKRFDGLTEREQEVVRLVSEGLSNKDIADRLCISSITVRHHLTSIFDKLGVSNRQKLLIRAHQNGFTRPPALA
ncbi:MAG: response regulator transcription factor [Nitrospira sp.]|nr:response regulator transcription factor [Nitrospira sp.]